MNNKISALMRLEAKEYIDLNVISKNKNFNWLEIVIEAKKKDLGIEPDIIYHLLLSFDINSLKLIKWISKINEEDFIQGLEIIAKDIFYGRVNSLRKL